MISTPRVSENLATVQLLIEEAKKNDAELVILPEFFIQITSSDDSERFAAAEQLGSGPIQAKLASMAQENQIYLIAGTILIFDPTQKKYFNTSLIYAPTGALIAHYHKIHLFSYDDGTISFDESRTFSAGDNVCCVDILGFKLGIAICYDLRFPELFRQVGKVDAIILPSAFTYLTGKAHWELLCRARAVENQCYFVGVNQGGLHETGRRTYGNSLVVDPWGEIVTSCLEGNQIIYTVLDKKIIQQIRQKLPALDHRKL